MKIIYIYLRRHCYNYDEKMFQYYVFKNRGYDLEVWSAVNWTFKDKQLDVPINIDKNDYCHYINNEKELSENIKRIKSEKCYFILYPYHANTIASWTIKKYIKKNKFSYCNITEDPVLVKNTIKIPLKQFFLRNLSLEIIKLLKVFVKFIISLLFFKPRIKELGLAFYNFFYPFIYKSDYNYITTPVLYYSFPNLLESFSKRNLLVHSSSYDEIKDIKSSKSEKYVVFVDQFLSGHSDIKKNGENFPVKDLKVYLQRLNNLFTKIENVYKCKVVIAAHPKAEYERSAFDGREIIYNKTAELISSALFVIIQYSTCFGNIVLNHKDFLNVYDKDFFSNSPQTKEYYEVIKKFFDCKQLDISDYMEVENIQDYLYKYNLEKYLAYENRFIKSEESTVDNKSFYEVVEENIQKR